LLPSDGEQGDRFGQSVAIWGETALIAAPYGDDRVGQSGAAYLFRFDGSTWMQETKFLSSDVPSYNDQFGSAGIWGQTFIVGVGADDDNGEQSGAAYIFNLTGPGDLTGDGEVDHVDYAKFGAQWGQDDCDSCDCDEADFTDDGSIGANDLRKLTDNWLTGK
jgi:hypothetical protein